MKEEDIIRAISAGEPFRGLPRVSVTNLELTPQIVPAMGEDGQPVPGRSRIASRPDIKFEVDIAGTKVTVYGELKNACTPKLAQQIAPWLASLKALKGDAAFAIICPVLSPQSQAVCDENQIDFIDLAGNISINIPGRLLVRRTGLKPAKTGSSSTLTDPFAPAASRVVRVLLQNPRIWTLTEIAAELRQAAITTAQGIEKLETSLSQISKTITSLEEELLVRRRGKAVLVPEPGRLLFRWAAKYKERYQWYLRRSFKCPNPFGPDLASIARGLDRRIGSDSYALTGAAAAQLSAPFVEVDAIDIFLGDRKADLTLRGLIGEKALGPDIRVVYPYDAGVFLYARVVEGVPIVSDIQAYLDLFARGGRDLRQAEYLLERVLEPRWVRR